MAKDTLQTPGGVGLKGIRELFALLSLFSHLFRIFFNAPVHFFCISCQNGHVTTPLHAAAENGHSRIVKLLVNKGGAKVNARNSVSFCRVSHIRQLTRLLWRARHSSFFLPIFRQTIHEQKPET